MDILPIEVRDIIYQHLATCRLRQICEGYFLDFFLLSKFLLANNGFIFGSAALSCFTLTNSFSDIDIWVPNQQISVGIFKEFFRSDQVIIFGKRIIYQKCDGIRLEIHSKIYGKFPNKHVDIISFDSTNFADRVDIDCSSIRFNGSTWDFPYSGSNIQWLITRQCKLINPFGSFKSSTPVNKLFYKIMRSIHLNRPNLDNLPEDHKIILSYILPTDVDIYSTCLQFEKIMADIDKKYPQGDKKYQIYRFVDKIINLTWNYKASLTKCFHHLQIDGENIDDDTKQIIFSQYIRIVKYILYGFTFTNLAELPQKFALWVANNNSEEEE